MLWTVGADCFTLERTCRFPYGSTLEHGDTRKPRPSVGGEFGHAVASGQCVRPRPALFALRRSYARVFPHAVCCAIEEQDVEPRERWRKPDDSAAAIVARNTTKRCQGTRTNRNRQTDNIARQRTEAPASLREAGASLCADSPDLQLPAAGRHATARKDKVLSSPVNIIK